MKKLTWIPIAVTASIVLCGLFGGWYIYRHGIKESPLQSRISSLPEVVSNEVSWEPEQLQIRLQLKSDADLRVAVQQAYAEASKQADKREITIDVLNPYTTSKLERWWSQQLFTIAEAMAHQKYSDIPTKLEKQAREAGLQVRTEMDERYVYITIQEKQGCKWVVLPLTGDHMGVWPNEQVPEIMA